MKITHSYSDITNWFFGTLQLLLQKQATVMVGLWGWSSFDSWYLELLDSDGWKNIETSRIRWCVTDERVNCDISDRNDEHIWKTFFLPWINKYGWLPEFLRPTMDSDGTEYSERVGNIDIAFFGMGPDGHTASLFPHHPALSSGKEWFIQIDNAPKLPLERISLSPKSIQSLSHVCLFAVGESKKEALANFLDETVSTDDCPVKLLRPEIVLDQTN